MDTDTEMIMDMDMDMGLFGLDGQERAGQETDGQGPKQIESDRIIPVQIPDYYLLYIIF